MSDFFQIVSVSGGKDSTALYCWAIDKFGKDGFTAVFADTGHEHPVTYNYVRNLPAMANGPDIHWVKSDFKKRLEKKGKEPSGNSFLDLMLWKGRAPSTRAQFCTEHLKLDPIRDWLMVERTKRNQIPIMYVGIRAAESAKRAKMPEEELNEKMDCLIKRPLLRWSEEAVFEYLKQKNVEPNPLYEGGFSRVGCFPCIHSRKSELARLPDWVWHKLTRWEATIGSTWFSYGTIPLTDQQQTEWNAIPGEWVYNCVGDENGFFLRDEKLEAEFKDRNSPTVEQVREWAKTTRGGRQFDLLAPTEDEKDIPSCMTSWGQCE